MDAFHSFWSKPNSCRNQGTVKFPDFELFTAILSALEWKKHNGSIRLITDSEGAAYFKSLGLINLWDSVDTSLDEIHDVDPFLFWAAGKLYALSKMETPCVMLDTDLIIWKDMSWVKDFDLVTAHSEALNPYVYPDQSIFKLKNGYTFPAEWDFSLDAANTAFLYIKDAAFRDYYVDAATTFFKHVEMDGLNPVTAMCFAEQRILPMCAAVKGQKMGYLLDLSRADEQDFVTHTWGFKDVLRSVPEANKEFCQRCMHRIEKEFPEKINTFDYLKFQIDML